MDSFMFLHLLICLLRSGILIRKLRSCIKIKNFSFLYSFQVNLNALPVYFSAANVILSKSHCLLSLLLSRETPLVLPSGSLYEEEYLSESQYQ